jgi:hypothetical protein
VVDEVHSGEVNGSAEGSEPAFAIVSAGLLAIGALALLSRPAGDKPATRRRSFGLLAILAGVAVYLLRPKPAVAEPAAWAPFEEPLVAAVPEVELSVPEEPEPEPEELLPAAQVEETADEEPNGWHVIAEAREQARARVEANRFVLVQSDESEQTEAVQDSEEAAHIEVARREPVEGVVDRVGLYSARPDNALEPAEAEGF